MAFEKQKKEEDNLRVKLKEQELREEARLEKQRTKDIKLLQEKNTRKFQKHLNRLVKT